MGRGSGRCASTAIPNGGPAQAPCGGRRGNRSRRGAHLRPNRGDDTSQPVPRLEQTPAAVSAVGADGAYDKRKVFSYLEKPLTGPAMEAIRLWRSCRWAMVAVAIRPVAPVMRMFCMVLDRSGCGRSGLGSSFAHSRSPSLAGSERVLVDFAVLQN